MYSLIATAKLNNVDPQAWLTGSPTYWAASPITPPGGCTSCCPGTGARRRSSTPLPRKNPPLLFLPSFLQITRR
jgi:hypothetical protein